MNDACDRTVVEVILKESLVLLRNFCPTHIYDAAGQASYLDLSFCSPDTTYLLNWSTTDNLYNSNYYPIFFRPSVDLKLGRLRKRKLNSADWARFKDSEIYLKLLQMLMKLVIRSLLVWLMLLRLVFHNRHH